MNAPELIPALKGVTQAADNQLSNFKKFMHISGQLNLLFAQIDPTVEQKSNNSRIKSDAQADSDSPVNDSDSDEEEQETTGRGRGSKRSLLKQSNLIGVEVNSETDSGDEESDSTD